MFVGTTIWSEKLLWRTEWRPSGVRKMRNHTEWRNSAIQKSNIPLPVSSTGQSVWLLIIRLRVRVAYRKFFYLLGHTIGDDEDEMICSTRVPTLLFKSKSVRRFFWNQSLYDPSYFIRTWIWFLLSLKRNGHCKKREKARIIVIYFFWKIDYTKFEPSFEQEKILYEPSNFNFYRKIDYIVFPNFELVDDGWGGERERR